MNFSTLLKVIKNLAFYGGVSREEYLAVKERMEDSNLLISKVYSIVSFIVTLCMYLVSLKSADLSLNKTAYMLSMILSVILIIIAYVPKKIPILGYISMYLTISIFLIFGIAIGFGRIEARAVAFMVLLVFMPLVWIDSPIRIIFEIIFFVGVFSIMAYKIKDGATRTVDITNALVFGFLAIFSVLVVYSTKIYGYVLEHKLLIMSEIDQLTGLNNRNCFEWKIDTYSSLYKSSICCVYVDANGLHELNNTEGHQAGDKMLCLIADNLKKFFGKNNTYRIGGDEFIAFVLEYTVDEIESQILELREILAKNNYHVAVGYEFCDAKDVDINTLIVSAESKMYKEKSEYYKNNERYVR